MKSGGGECSYEYEYNDGIGERRFRNSNCCEGGGIAKYTLGQTSL